jgi:hypothetical protein
MKVAAMIVTVQGKHRNDLHRVAALPEQLLSELEIKRLRTTVRSL